MEKNVEKSITAVNIKLLQKSRQLHILFDDGKQFSYACEQLRRCSPAADNTVNSTDGNVEDVNITSIIPVGNYAIRLVFNDGHNTGIYSWEMLYSLGKKVKKNN